MKNSNSHSTTCSHPHLCYDSLIKKCVTCMNRSNQATNTNITCSPPHLCYDRLIKQCVSCKTMERGSGKAMRTTGSCAWPHLCYDRLIKQCIDCTKLHRSTEESTAILGVVTTTHQETQVPAAQSMGHGGSTFFVFAVYALVGLVLTIAAGMWLVTQKNKRRQRRIPAKEDCEEDRNFIRSLEHAVHQSPNLWEKQGPVVLHTCPYSNGTAKTSRDDILERNINCIAVAESNVSEATSLSSCDKKCNHTFPLPATELGATVLVTTKTT